MENKKNKTIILTVALIIVASALSLVFGYTSLRSSGKIGSLDSSEIMKTFDKYFNSKDRIVIFYARPDCGYCQLQTPILETIAEDYDMKYYYVNTNELSKSQKDTIRKKLKIEEDATPTTVIVENGEVIDQHQGYLPGQEYVEFLINSGMLKKGSVYSAEANITFITYSKYKKMIESSDKNIVVIGQTTCSHCIAFKPAINTVAGEYDVVINYLNLTDMTEEESSAFFESLKTLKYDDPDFIESGSIGTPLTLLIENGRITGYVSGERTTSQLVKEFKKLGIIK